MKDQTRPPVSSGIIAHGLLVHVSVRVSYSAAPHCLCKRALLGLELVLGVRRAYVRRDNRYAYVEK
eukprot:scaffold62798_cov11-Prasinocladus_malaysianus.AAC.1